MRTVSAGLARGDARGAIQTMITALATSSTPGLRNGSFYQAAAALLGVLLLTGVVTEVRATRTESTADWPPNQWSRWSLYGFLALSAVVLVGELAALTVLLRQEASPVLQAIVGVSLILGLVGVPGLVFLGVASDVVGSTNVMRWVRITSIYAAVVACVVVGLFALPPIFTGSPGVGTPNTPATPPTYLSALLPNGGDPPQLGDVQLGNHRLLNSIFYEHVGAKESHAVGCESVPTCRATSYALGGGYNRFTATFGVRTNSSVHQHVHWRVLLDGRVVAVGACLTNEAPVPLELSVEGGHNLELRASSEYAAEATIVWGNARVY
jgi:NPCBM/NEW2 domain